MVRAAADMRGGDGGYVADKKERGGSAPGKGIDLTVADFLERLRLPGAAISAGIFTGGGDPGLTVAAGGDLRWDRHPLF